MNARALVTIFVAGLGAAHAAHAVDLVPSVEIGTTGFGLHVTTPLATKFNARFGVNYANYSYDGNTSDIEYDLKLKLASVDALLDYYPFDNALRISGGAVYNGNKVDARGKPNANGTYNINGTVYSAAAVGTLSGKADFRNLAPYLGIGYGNALQQAGWSFAADLGVIFQGSSRTELASNGCTVSSALCARLASDVASENARLADEVDDYKFFPVLRVGVSYRF